MRRLIFLLVTLVPLGLACKQGAKQAPSVSSEAPAIKLAPEDIVAIGRGELQTGPRISGTLQAANRAVVRAESAASNISEGSRAPATARVSSYKQRGQSPRGSNVGSV